MPKTHTAQIQTGANNPQGSMRRKILSGEVASYATVMVAVLCDHFRGFDWFEWEPDVLGQEVEDDLGVEMPQHVRDMIWGFVAALTTDRFYRDVTAFNHICNALSGGPTPMEHFEPATIEEIAWAVLEVGMSDLDDQDQEFPFSPEIGVYVGYQLKDAGLKPFAPLDFVPDLGYSEGFDMADDLAMAAVQATDRSKEREEIIQGLEDRVKQMHLHLEQVGLSAKRQKP